MHISSRNIDADLYERVYVKRRFRKERFLRCVCIELTWLYDVGKSVFDPLDGTDSVPDLARNYHLAALQDRAVARPNPEILSAVACNRKIKVISVRESGTCGGDKLARFPRPSRLASRFDPLDEVIIMRGRCVTAKSRRLYAPRRRFARIDKLVRTNNRNFFNLKEYKRNRPYTPHT